MGAELKRYFCKNTQFRKKSEDQWESETLIPSGYASDINYIQTNGLDLRTSVGVHLRSYNLMALYKYAYYNYYYVILSLIMRSLTMQWLECWTYD